VVALYQNLHQGYSKNYVWSLSIIAVVVSLTFPNVPVFAASVPSAPQYVEAMAGATEVAVTWDAPSSNGGESGLKYTARVWTVPPPTSTPVFASCSTTNFGCVVGGLVSGSNYYVDVVASNSAGLGAPSALKPISPGRAGIAPSNVSASVDSKGLMTVKWTPLTSFSGGTFAWYTAEAFTSSEISIGSYAGFCTESSIAANSCLIGGLRAGVSYFVQVRTVSSVGSSYPSTPRFHVEAIGSSAPSPIPSKISTGDNSKLSAPQQVKVVALSKSVRVSWKAPAITAGKVILNYSVGAYTANGALIATCKTLPKLLTCTIKGLKPNQKISIGVIAKYSGYLSPMSKLVPVVPKE
jgi:hypothetical protein